MKLSFLVYLPDAFEALLLLALYMALQRVEQYFGEEVELLLPHFSLLRNIFDVLKSL